MAERSTFLLTGVTGFLGKVVLAELIRRKDELRVDQVYVVIRARADRDAQRRFDHEVARSPCFSQLPEGWTSIVSVLQGTLEHADLNLNGRRAEVTERVTHIVHAAASVSFDLPIASAARSNITTSLNVLELARECRRLERMVSVSTAYVTPHPGDGVPVQEALAPLPSPAAELYEAIEKNTIPEAELLKRSGHPNTYTLTKSIAEHLITERRGNVPLSIVRPSIISASRQYPFPGWIDSTSGFGAFVLLIGLGHLRAMIGGLQNRIDLVPVDEVASRVLYAARKDQGSTPGILHAVAGEVYSPTIHDCWEGIRDFYRTHPVARWPEMHYVGPTGLAFTAADLVHHRLPIVVASMRKAKVRAKARSLGVKLSYLNRVFPYFTSNSFAFRSSLPMAPGFDYKGYIRLACKGMYRHVLRRDDAEWPLAGRKHPGHGGDLRWATTQPNGNLWIRFASWVVTKVLRRAVERVTVDIPSFQAARAAMPEGSALVLVPNHRSYLDFVLCSYLAFARPDLGIPIPYIAATMEFGKIPILGRILSALHAFYLRRGTGREDPNLTRRVHQLIREGKALEFFVEGQRSRSREFLPPKRGLLRCLQATGTPCTLFPVALTYDRVPEEKAFAAELSGAPKPKMRLSALVKWAWNVWRGRIDLGRIHIACGDPVQLDHESDVHGVSQDVIRRLREATVVSTYHIAAYLARHELDGMDAEEIRRHLEARGTKVYDSALKPHPRIDPGIARTMREQFGHHFEGQEVGAGNGNGALAEPESFG